MPHGGNEESYQKWNKNKNTCIQGRGFQKKLLTQLKRTVYDKQGIWPHRSLNELEEFACKNLSLCIQTDCTGGSSVHVLIKCSYVPADITAEELFNMFFGGGFPNQNVYTRRGGRWQRTETHTQNREVPTFYVLIDNWFHGFGTWSIFVAFTRPLIISFLSQINPCIDTHFFMIHSNIVLPSMPKPS